MTDIRAEGERVRREVLGDAHVDRGLSRATDFDRVFQDFATTAAWGAVWTSDRLTRRERSMVTLAILAATGATHEIPLHVRATARTGATPDDIAEVFLHVGAYAGVPRANTAFAIARQTLEEMAAETAAPEEPG